MKKLLLVLMLACACMNARSQTAASYSFSAFSTTYASISGTGTAITGGFINCDDCNIASIPIGFTFNYCGTSYTQLSACTNGWLSLTNSTAINWGNDLTNLAAIGSGVGVLMPFWDDLQSYSSIPSGAYYQTSGTTPNRIFTFEWKNFGVYLSCGSSCIASFQVKLYESSNVIDFIYDNSTYSSRTATIGITNSTSDYQTLNNVTSSPTPTSSSFISSLNPSPATGQVYRWFNQCTGTPVTGSVSATVTTGCSPYTSILSLPGSSVGTGLTYQWQSSPDNTTWTNITGATNSTYTATVTASTYYRCIILCTFSGSSATSPSILLTLNTPPAAIGGPTTVCVGNTITLTDVTSGGTWSSSTPSVATIGATTGVVTGVTVGTSVISYTLSTGCFTTVTVNVVSAPATISGPASVCVGSSITLTNAVSGGTWSSSNPAVATAGATTGVVTGITTGVVTITYAIGSCIATKSITVNAVPAAIGGPTSVCVGSTVTLTDATSGGTWSSASPGIASVGATTGIVTGVSAGIAIISYTLPGGCAAIRPITVNPLPSSITGLTTVCVGESTTLSSSGSGTWSSSNPAVATVGATTGTVTGVSGGTATITYTLPTGCFGTFPITVYPLPAPITGSASVCVGSTSLLADATSGGFWSSSNPSIAYVDPGTGLVTGISVGTATISYTIGTGCSATLSVTVNPPPGAISGTLGVCVGSTTTLFSSTPGGTWSSGTPSVATISASSGLVTGVAPGTTTITYTLPTGCSVTATVTVNPLPAPISGSGTVCVGLTTLLTDVTPGGTWSSGSPAIATVGPTTGLVTGISPGTATIYYTLPSGCSGTPGSFTITVNSTPAPITGPGSVCIGSTITLADAVPGGTWSSSTPSVATIGAGSGVVSGVATGITTISYSVGSGCLATRIISVNALPGAIGGPAAVCAGGTATLTSTPAGGTWSSGTTTVATIGATSGIVNGLTPGTTIITYTLSTGCTRTRTLTVNPTPAPITGPTSVCVASTITLSDPSAGGSWSMTPMLIATIGTGTGVVTGVSGGTATATYTLAATGCFITRAVTVNPLPALCVVSGGGSLCPGSAGVHIGLGCSNIGITYQLFNGTTAVGSPLAGTGAALDFGLHSTAGTYTVVATNSTTGCSRAMTGSATITINPPPSPVSGASAVCVGATTALTSTPGGGTWTSSAPAIATVGGGSGIVTGVTTGTATITYTLPTGCYAIHSMTVSAAPGPILGPGIACTGAITTTLGNAVPGGVWSSGSPGTAIIGSLSGIVTGLSTGTAVITYSLGTGCTVTRTITVHPSPAPVSGISNICVGASTTFTCPTAGGLWSSSAVTIATVGGTTGVVTGITAGTATIAYTLATGCSSVRMVTVNPLPTAIGGTLSVCVNSTTTLSNSITGGTWSSGSPAIAVIGATTGIVTGMAAGTSTITYTTASGCSITAVVTVNPVPAPITGSGNLCVGLTTTLSDATPGGVWSTTTPATGTISTTGIVTGIAPGPDTIFYTLPLTGCAAMRVLTVNPVPAPIGGAAALCVGQTLTLTNTVPGGTWSSAAPTIATVVSTTGVVTGMAFGMAPISYTAGGCSVTATVTVIASPAPIAGPTSVCVGQTIVKTDPSPGGTWSSADPSVATIGPTTGVVSGLSSGTAIISYTLGTTGCAAITPVVVNPISPIQGVTSVCVGQTITLTDTALGGTWTSGTPAVATIGPVTGIVTGISAGTTIIDYTLPTGCMASTTVTVQPIPSVITGLPSACVGQLVPMTDTIPGGTWSSSNPVVADIDASSGIVTAVSAGTVTLSYTLGTGCFRTKTFTVYALPPAINGPDDVCIGSTVIYSNPAGAGSWSSSVTTVATIGSLSGALTGVSLGTTIITFNLLSTGCMATKAVNVVDSPTATATAVICQGQSVLLSGTPAGGTWSSASPSVATVATTTGLATGMAAGTTTIFYSIGIGCTATTVVTVQPTPMGISGGPNLCVGSATLMTSGPAGGTWSSSDPFTADIHPTSGMVTGVAVGTAIITYTLSTGCMTTALVNVNAGPAPITGINTVCVGGTTTLSDATPGGVWSSSAPATGSVDVAGTVYGIATGTTTISYTVTGFVCPSTMAVSVNPVPTLITGPLNLCQGATATYANGVPGGTWSSSNPAVATIAATTGTTATATGISAGMVTITYTLGAGCAETLDIVVDPIPSPIAGATNVCTGQTITLSSATPGGTWSSSNPAAGTVNTAGIVTGISAGTTTISYTNSLGCGVPHAVTVNQAPGPITGSGNICLGGTSVLSDSIAGGTWFSLNTTIATIHPVTGVVTGVSLGGVTIVYQLPGGCFVSRAINVYPLPIVFTVTGGGNHCSGDTGVHIGLSGSTVGVNYLLYNGSTAVGTFPGTGSALDFGLHTVAGTYTATGTSTATTCSINMAGSAAVGIIPSVVPSVTISSSPNDTVCAGATATFTPVPTNGGTAPLYQWSVNGVPVSLSGSYSFIPADGDVVSVAMTSNATCPMPATVSDSERMTVQPFGTPEVSMALSPNDTVCKGTVVTINPVALFAGTAPVYTWVKNGFSVSTGATYTFVPDDGDVVFCTMTSNYPCRLANIDTSTAITVVVDTPLMPVVSIAATPGWVVSKGAYDTLTATAINAENPTYQWYINGYPVAGATNATYISNTFSYPHPDSVSVQVTSHGICTSTRHEWLYVEVTAVGVQQLTGSSDITVIPNPNRGTFTIKGTTGTTDEAVAIELTDMLGRQVYSGSTVAKGGRLSEQVTLGSTVANGMYLLNIRTETGNKVFHVVVEQ